LQVLLRLLLRFFLVRHKDRGGHVLFGGAHGVDELRLNLHEFLLQFLPLQMMLLGLLLGRHAQVGLLLRGVQRDGGLVE
jgi:hypothetical protein